MNKETESTPRDYYAPLSFLEHAIPGKHGKGTEPSSQNHKLAYHNEVA